MAFNILGINIGHDCGEAIINNAELIAVNEDLLSRVKLHSGFSNLADKEVLHIAQLQPSDIDSIVDEAPAVVHVDRIARPQIITKSEHPSFYKILTVYCELTGIGILVNTSFNLQEEPIVNTPQEAIATFQKSKLNALDLGDYLVEQKR